MDFLYILLFLIGLLTMIFSHLTIPLCVVKSKKHYENGILWLISLAGGLVGFIVCAILVEQFRGIVGILQSAFWTVIGYLILKIRCSNKTEKAEKENVETLSNTDTKPDSEIKEKIKNLYTDFKD